MEKWQIQATYEKWWLNKTVKSISGEKIGKVKKVYYAGNKVYGTVLLTLDDGSEYCVATPAYRPRKTDLIVE